MKKNNKDFNHQKKSAFFLCFFFDCWKTKLPLVFCFVFPFWNWKKGWKECLRVSFEVFFKEKKICFSFHFFIIKWIYSKKSLSVWINQQNRFFFFLPQYHHLQLQHTTFSFKLNNPIIKKITNTHFFSFFLFFFILFFQPSSSSFNQKTNKSKERPQEWICGYNIRFFFWRLKRNIWSHFNPKKCYNCKCSLSSPLFILLQETHVTFEKDLNHLKNCLRKYLWFKNPFSEWKWSLAIGIKRMESLHDIEPYPIESSESGLFGLRTKIFNTKYAVMNIYHHYNLKLPFMQDQIGKFFSKDGLNILGGDFN